MKMLSAEGTGKTIEKAIESALFELKASREDVDIKILCEGGLFKKAKVIVTVSEDAKEKYTKRSEKVKKEDAKVETVPTESNTQKTASIEQTLIKEQKPKEKVVEKAEPDTKPVEKKEREPRIEKILDPMEFLQGLFQAMGKTVEIAVKEEERFITYSVTGENLGSAIGHRGETFYAISNLLTAVSGKQEKRILLDIENYREKRAESLSAIAKRVADKVCKTGRYMKLEPMNPTERRVIHTALQEDDRVTTLSKGTEPHRYVIIFPKEYQEK